MPHRSLLRRAFGTALVVPAFAAALLISACSPGPADTSDDTLAVVATTTQLADFAREVGGDAVKVTGLLPAGGSAHHFDPAPKDLLALGKADVLVVNGAGLEGFIDSAVEASGFTGETITAADGIDLEAAREITAEGAVDGEGHDDHDHDHDHADEHDGDDDDHDHDHGDLNPHLWTSPRFASAMVGEIARGFAAADPAHADGYAKRAKAYQDRLAALDGWIGAQFERVPASERILVTGHDSLRYYLHDYGITFAGSIMPSFEDNAEPSAAEIDALVKEIKAHGVKAVFVESSMSPKLAETIAKEAGIKVVKAESIYADSLGVAGSGADTYVDATVHNTRLILEAWGAQIDPLPEAVGSAK